MTIPPQHAQFDTSVTHCLRGPLSTDNTITTHIGWQPFIEKEGRKTLERKKGKHLKERKVLERKNKRKTVLERKDKRKESAWMKEMKTLERKEAMAENTREKKKKKERKLKERKEIHLKERKEKIFFK